MVGEATNPVMALRVAVTYAENTKGTLVTASKVLANRPPLGKETKEKPTPIKEVAAILDNAIARANFTK
jgi:hypothetical protein